ncbi:hypothetical protein PG985_005084 [Apiospora marii]|uniref:uncharacterized protein n=1 Tax=Apiospora marii TaxID=335849 RepID=UPI0031307B3F
MSRGRTPLHGAIANGHHEVAQALLSAGANINLADDSGMSPVHNALVFQHDNMDRGTIILAASQSCDATQKTALHWAAELNDCEAVKTLLLRNANTSVRDHCGDTPFMKATRTGCLICVKLLLPHSDPNVSNKTYERPIHVASQKSVDVVEYLLDHGALLDPPNQSFTPFDWAAMGNNVEVGRYLHNCGVDVNRADNTGHTAIFHATICWAPDFVTLLLGLPEVDLSIKNNAGETVLHHVAKLGSPLIAKAFLDVDHLQGLDPEAIDSSGKTALDVLKARLEPSAGFEDIFQSLVAKLGTVTHGHRSDHDMGGAAREIDVAPTNEG